jgi:hypothetical protein
MAGEIDASWDPEPGTPGSLLGDDAGRGSPDGQLPSRGPVDSGTGPAADAAGSGGGPNGGGASGSEPNPGTTNEPDGGINAMPPPPEDRPWPTAGEVLITEVMYDPSVDEPAGEWIELRNTTSTARTLSGLTLADGGGRVHEIGGTTLAIPAGAYVVLARSRAGAVAAKVPASAIVYEYGAGGSAATGIQLSNSATGGVWLRRGDVTITQAAYGGWQGQQGSSLQLVTQTHAASALEASWCVSQTPWSPGSDRGTPGRPSDCR